MNGDKYWFWLVVMLMSALIVFGGYALVMGKSLEGASLIVGGIMTKLSTLIDFKYGSSEASPNPSKGGE